MYKLLSTSVSIHPNVGTVLRDYGGLDRIGVRPFYATASFRQGFPEIVELQTEWLARGRVPNLLSVDYRSETRLSQLRDAGWRIPDDWVQHKETFGEREIREVLIDARVMFWPEVVVPVPGRGRSAVPWRLDFLVLGCADPLGSRPAVSSWVLFAIEVDGPLHNVESDARRDRTLFEHYGVTTVRIDAGWARTDPWACVKEAFRRVGALLGPEFDHVDGLERLESYVCAVCNRPLQRRNMYDLIKLRDNTGAHQDCSERAEQWHALLHRAPDAEWTPLQVPVSDDDLPY